MGTSHGHRKVYAEKQDQLGQAALTRRACLPHEFSCGHGCPEAQADVHGHHCNLFTDASVPGKASVLHTLEREDGSC